MEESHHHGHAHDHDHHDHHEHNLDHDPRSVQGVAGTAMKCDMQELCKCLGLGKITRLGKDEFRERRPRDSRNSGH